MRYLPLAILVIIAASSTARAEDFCEGTTQYDMNMCAGREFEKTDKAMNERYAKLMKRLDPEDQVKLRQAQKAWVSYRQKMCEFEASGLGTVRSTIFAGCLTFITEGRIKYLEGHLNCEEGDLSCKGRSSDQN
ncbi:lysozyme inhibitor LprI family protein [Microvirga mediterraneensis]|uniref:DUF1311 domain-containing protein n=1 Tax=Microvirga mediterraneensis TaxID=2754695 RepID=A0A838BQR0_9HYPH|nr:lysozyme inhibitor LprI family protein [Microvirga mediterraneensis]MBA1158094.1 DUF1311 domain-containing protein [Microvirga mediterraneensis]